MSALDSNHISHSQQSRTHWTRPRPNVTHVGWQHNNKHRRWSETQPSNHAENRYVWNFTCVCALSDDLIWARSSWRSQLTVTRRKAWISILLSYLTIHYNMFIYKYHIYICSEMVLKRDSPYSEESFQPNCKLSKADSLRLCNNE